MKEIINSTDKLIDKVIDLISIIKLKASHLLYRLP